VCELAIELRYVEYDKPDNMRRVLDRALRKLEGPPATPRDSRSAVDDAGERVSR